MILEMFIFVCEIGPFEILLLFQIVLSLFYIVAEFRKIMLKKPRKETDKIVCFAKLYYIFPALFQTFNFLHCVVTN